MEKFAAFARIAEIEFSDIVLSTQYLGNKLRIYLKDTSFIDFFFTTRLQTQRFSIHCERKHFMILFFLFILGLCVGSFFGINLTYFLRMWQNHL